MSKIKDTFEKVTSSFNTSKYFKPLTFFILLFFLSGSLVFLFELGRNREFFNIMDGLWWAIITFSTTGYGDKVPITSGGRMVAVISIFIGIAGMSFLSGTFASVFVDRNTRAISKILAARLRKTTSDMPTIFDALVNEIKG